ncbi:membrane protein of unknown function [Tepidibacter aestuarii]|nr:membrane protein of unknown function [Tepidibacter aestuarii]
MFYFFNNDFGAVGSSMNPLLQQKPIDVVAKKKAVLNTNVHNRVFNLFEIFIILIPPVKYFICSRVYSYTLK